MADTPNTSPEKPKKKIITVGDSSAGERGGGGRGTGERPSKGRGGRGRDRDEGDRKPGIPAALMRGPRPKPKAEAVPEAAPEEAVSEDAVSEDAVAEESAVEETTADSEPMAEATVETTEPEVEGA